MIVDFRARPPTPEFKAYFQPELVEGLGQRMGARSVSPAFLEGSLEGFFTEMDDAGVDYIVALGRNSPEVVSGGITLPACAISNEHILDLQTRYSDRIVGFAGIDVSNTAHDALREIERFVVDEGLKGVFLEPQRALGAHPDDPRLFPVYELCADKGIPVSMMTGVLAGAHVGFADPTPIDIVASRFPDLKIVCGHGCWPRVAEIVAVALKHPNVFISPDVYQYLPGISALYFEAANGFLADQFVFGSAYPIYPLKQAVEDFHEFGLTPASLQKALGDNAGKLLGL